MAEAFASADDAMLPKLVNREGLTSMSNGTRRHFNKLLVLDFLASSILLIAEEELELWRTEYSSWSGVAIISGDLPIGSLTVEEYMKQLKKCEIELQELQEHSEAIDFVIESIRRYTLPEKKAPAGEDATAEDEDMNRRLRLDEQMFILRSLCHQRRSNVVQAIELLNRTFEGQNKALNIQESVSVKRLSILASIFLPLSLSASILSMQTRFKDLHLRLYDFLGVFVIIGTAAMLMLTVVRMVLKFRSSSVLRDWLSPGRLWRDNDASLKSLRYAGRFLITSDARKNAWTIKTPLRYSPKLFAVLSSIWYASVWAVLLISFIIGMVHGVILGLKILGFGAAGLLGYLLIGLLVWIVVLDREVSRELQRVRGPPAPA